jgi:hypothetical protein
LHADGYGDADSEATDDAVAAVPTEGLGRLLGGKGPPPPSDPVKLRREWKGPTVRSQIREGSAMTALPGVRKRTADREDTTRLGRVLPGPRRTRRPPHWGFWLAVVLGGAAIALCSFGG